MLQEPRREPPKVPHLRVVPRESPPIETSGGTISTSVVETLDQLVGLEREWDHLFQKSAFASPPLRWGWVREWWRYFGTPQRSLAILTVRRGRELIGVLPLYEERIDQRRSSLFIVSLSNEPRHSFYPEYIDVLTAPGADTIVSNALIELMSHRKWGRYRGIHLGICRKNGALELGIAPAMKRPWGRITKSDRRAPIADLRGGFEEYLGRLSANSRQQMRRILRSFREQTDLRFEVAQTREEADIFLRELIDLHQVRWRRVGQPGAFSTPERIAFHRAVVDRLFNHVVLARLTYRGLTVTGLYGFVVGTKFDFYQSGNSAIDMPLKRSGILAHLLLMEALIQRGIETYDFLEGEAPYKMQLCTATLELSEVSVYGPSPYTLIHRCREELSVFLERFLR